MIQTEGTQITKKDRKEHDMDKYLVLKWDDINRLPYYTREFVSNLNLMIKAKRDIEGKPQNQYLVLNLEDEFDRSYLLEKLSGIRMNYELSRIKVKDIAVALVNAILKAKGD